MYPTLRRLMEDRREWYDLPDDVVAWLERHAPIQWKRFAEREDVVMYRGSQGRRIRGHAAVVPEMTTYRPAQNVGDMYKIILDKANPNYPRRGYSTVGSTHRHGAEPYGKVYYIFAPDDCTVGLVNSDDLHTTGILGNTFGDAESVSMLLQRTVGIIKQKLSPEFDHACQKVYKLVYMRNHAMDEQEINQIFKHWAEATESEVTMMHENDRDDLYMQMARRVGDDSYTWNWLRAHIEGNAEPYVDAAARNSAYKYETYGITLTTPVKLLETIGKRGASEVWFEGPYVAISATEADHKKAPGYNV